MPTLDTNLILRWLIDDVPEHTAVVEAVLATPERRFAVPDIVVVETVCVLERVMRLSRAMIAQAIETVMSEAAIDIDRKIWPQVLAGYLLHPKLSITDVYLEACTQRTHRVPLLTFDQELANQLTGAQLATEFAADSPFSV